MYDVCIQYLYIGCIKHIKACFTLDADTRAYVFVSTMWIAEVAQLQRTLNKYLIKYIAIYDVSLFLTHIMYF